MAVFYPVFFSRKFSISVKLSNHLLFVFIFQLAGNQFDCVDEKSEGRYFETIYALLDSISPQYRNTFGDTLIRKLQHLQNNS